MKRTLNDRMANGGLAEGYSVLAALLCARRRNGPRTRFPIDLAPDRADRLPAPAGAQDRKLPIFITVKRYTSLPSFPSCATKRSTLNGITRDRPEKVGLHPVSRTPRLGVMMELEVCHGSQAIYAGVQGLRR
jgi:hypothetical protein